MSDDPRMQYRRQTNADHLHESTIVDGLTCNIWRQLRYGENPGQASAVYTFGGEAPFDILQEHPEKMLSYTNVMNADMAMKIVRRISSVFLGDRIAVILKHTGPSGVARYATMAEAFEKAWNCDPEAAFGSVDGFSHEVDEDTARLIVTDRFVETVIAPGYTDHALEVLAKKPRLRVLWARPELPHYFIYRPIDYGHLGQERFISHVNSVDNFEVVSEHQPASHQLQAALFNWQIVPYVLSNAIVIGRERYTAGICGGQPHRNRALRWAAENAEYVNKNDTDGPSGATAVSDAFFPFKDSVTDAVDSEIAVLVAPLGSERDTEVIEEADKHGIVFLAPFYYNEQGEKIYERAFSH